MQRSWAKLPLVAALLMVLAPMRGVAETPTAPASSPPPPTRIRGPKEFPPFAELPGAADPELAAHWREGIRRENARDFLGSAREMEVVVDRVPNRSHTYWRIAKNYWRYSANLPREDIEGRRQYATLAEQWADRGLAVDPNCGECCLYKVAGMGGLIRLNGSVLAATQASTIAELLERGIVLVNRQPHPEDNPELEELYYAAAQFYKGVPEWFWLKWVIGVQGSRRRAVDYMRHANAIAGQRPSYMVETGALLLCVGKTEADPAATAEATTLLRQVTALQSDDLDDAVDRQHAGILLAAPDKACDYSRDEWIDKAP